MKSTLANTTNGRAFIDSSAWIAYFNQQEPQHLEFIKLFKEAVGSHLLLYTSNDIVDETYTRLRYDVGRVPAQKFISYLEEALSTKTLTQLWTIVQIQADAIKILKKYADQALSLTDATSAILMKKFDIRTIFTLDSTHFSTLGFKSLP